MTEAIRSLADLRPGDLMFTEIRRPWPVSLLVKLGQLFTGDRVRLGRVSVDHVGVVTQAPEATTHALSRHLGREVLKVDVQGVLIPHTPPMLVQAMPSGAEEIRMSPSRHWRPGVAYVRLAEDYPGQALDAAAVAREFVAERVPYSFLSYAYLAAWIRGIRAPRLAARINRRRPPLPPPYRTMSELRGVEIRLPAEAICSVLADQAWTLAGKQVMPEGTRPQVVTPGALFLHTFRRQGTVTGGAGLIEST
jgi:hypothetical protein